ncbi:MAG: ATP-binding protein [Limisphaerales bacterium]
MRRETDFVLERAAWPAMLLEEGGSIRRANQAARRMFGFSSKGGTLDLAGIWDPSNEVSPENLLRAPATGEITRLKLRVAGDGSAQFVAHLAKVVRESSVYLVLQLFKSSGGAFPDLVYAPSSKETPSPVKAAATPAKKSTVEEGFLLQNAGWPALLLRKTGKVLRANPAAIVAFGGGIEKEDATLASIWPEHNQAAAQQFLTDPPERPVLKVTLKSGLPAAFEARLCGTADEQVFLLQLLPEKAQAKAEAAPPGTPAGAGEADASLAHKQKLDCALQLARSVALDFNNALTSILGHASLLLSKTESTHPWRNSLTEIEKSAAKAAEIANDLGAFSRQEKDAKVQVAGNLNVLLERTLDAFQSSMEKPITISRQLERRLYTANFDEAKMQQALAKVLENAVESIPGEGKISVQTRNVELAKDTQDGAAKLAPGNYVCVVVSDTGEGIPAEVMPRIFEPFFTTKGARHRGLGLAWVYGIVTNHGGGVGVSSQRHEGTIVRLYLPATGRIVREAPMSPADLSGTQTVLLVDDDDLLLTMGQMVLSSFGYTVLTANSGKKGLEIISTSKKKIDLMITDLVMPNMSGRELTEQVLRLKPETRILWSSGYVRAPGTQEQEPYLQKPFSSQDLLRKVKEILTTQGKT